MSEAIIRSCACRYCSLSQVGSPSAFAEYYKATPIIEQTQSQSAFAKFYEATPIIGQTQSQSKKVKLMKKQMEVIKAMREGKKSGGGDKKPSELLKAVKEDLERLDVKQEKDDTQDHGCDDNEDNRDMERGRREGEGGEDCHEAAMTPEESELGEGEYPQ